MSAGRAEVLLDPSPHRDHCSSNRHRNDDQEQTDQPIVSYGCCGLRDRLEGPVQRKFLGPIAIGAVEGARLRPRRCPIAR